MAIKTFTTGEVLTAADTNTYLGNAGLVFVKSQTVGTNQLTVSVADAFSATYDNYKITYTGGAIASNGPLDFNLNGSTLAHYGILSYNGYGGGSGTVPSNNAARWTHIGAGVNLVPNVNIELQTPFLAKPTFVMSNYSDGTNTGMFTGYQSQSLSFTGFTITAGSGMTGGTIVVYGYRKP